MSLRLQIHSCHFMSVQYFVTCFQPALVQIQASLYYGAIVQTLGKSKNIYKTLHGFVTIPSKKTLQTYILFERIFVGDFINGSPVAHTPIRFQPSLRSLDKVALQKNFETQNFCMQYFICQYHEYVQNICKYQGVPFLHFF